MNDLIQYDDAQDETALSVAKAGDWLPRLKLCQSTAKEVQKKQVASGGNYALVTSKDELVDLGDTVDCVVCAGRPKALRIGDSIFTFFDPESQEFKDIEAESKTKDSGCMYGPEYLIWVPDHDTFALFHMNSATARRDAPSVHSRLKKAAILGSKLIEGKKHSWFGPTCTDLNTPVTNLPSQEAFEEEIRKFRAERPSQVKSAESPDRDR